MLAKRLVIATILGVLCGLFCMYGTIAKFPEFAADTLFLAGIVYNRALIGIVAMAIFSANGMMPLRGFGLVYGVLIDVVTSKLEDRI